MDVLHHLLHSSCFTKKVCVHFFCLFQLIRIYLILIGENKKVCFHFFYKILENNINAFWAKHVALAF